MESSDLGDRLEAIVSELVSEGRYQDRASVLRQGVLLVEERERKLRRLDEALDRGLADIEAGRTVPADEVFGKLEARFGRAPPQRR